MGKTQKQIDHCRMLAKQTSRAKRSQMEPQQVAAAEKARIRKKNERERAREREQHELEQA